METRFGGALRLAARRHRNGRRRAGEVHNVKTVGSGRVRVLTIFAAFIAAVVAILGLGSASSYAAPGNNGTVKVNDTLIDQIPDNAPHPECAFNVQWFNFDGVIVTSQVTFEAQDQDIEVTTVTGDTSANFRGGPGPNHSEDYILKFEGEPHPQQGYHVKVTISTNDSNGNDTKSKVFWVSPCQTPTPTTSTTSTSEI